MEWMGYRLLSMHSFPDHYASVKSNCAQPPSPPGNCGAFAYLVSPGGGSISKFCTSRVGWAQLYLTDVLMFRKECLHIPSWETAIRQDLAYIFALKHVNHKETVCAEILLNFVVHEWLFM